MSESILQEAQRLIHGERNKNYGHPRENFADISALFSGYLGVEITDIDVANLMILVKIARVKGTGYHRDSFTDIAGYAGCVERIYEEPLELDESNVQQAADALKGVDPATLADWERELLGMGTPVKTGEPREWDSLADVPYVVRVKDTDGDIWEYDFVKGWRWQKRGAGLWHAVTDPKVFNHLHPFTEIIEEFELGE